ncbi:MAG: hypothetical protein U0931_04070 [Vulcanimicrobiota bacterium]
MRKLCLMTFVAVSATLASAQTLDGARVTGVTGRVEVQVDKLWKVLRMGEQLAQNAVVQLAEGAHLSLRYRADGHREEARGPGQFTVGQASASSIVTSYGFHNRALQLPHSGGLDAVGGSIANASGTRAPSFRLRNDTSPPPPAAPVGRAIMPSPPITRPYVQEPLPSQVTLAWQESASPSLVSTIPPDQLRIGGFDGEAIVLDGDKEVARLSVKDSQPVDLSSLALQEDTLYLVRLEEAGEARSTMSFRLLNADERIELLRLVAQTEVSKEQRPQRLDRFIALGQYHLAAQEGKSWLEEQTQPSAYLLQLVYDLNRDILHDTRQTQYWQEWAGSRQLPLVP